MEWINAAIGFIKALFCKSSKGTPKEYKNTINGNFNGTLINGDNNGDIHK